jgi:hypothetical protein
MSPQAWCWASILATLFWLGCVVAGILVWR